VWLFSNITGVTEEKVDSTATCLLVFWKHICCDGSTIWFHGGDGNDNWDVGSRTNLQFS
jgi:hypothetical protein